MRLRMISIAMFGLAASSLAVAAAQIDPAQAIAQKFSEATDDKPAASPQPKPAPSPQTKADPQVDRPSIDYEMDMLRRARAEELERQQQAAPKPATKIAEPAPALAPPPAPAPVAVIPPTAPPAPAAPTIAPTATPAPLVHAAATAPAPAPAPATAPAPPPAPAPVQPPAPAPKPVETAISPPPAPQPEPPASDANTGARATVLLVLDTSENNPVTAIKPDPIICFDQECWVSDGIEAPAHPLSRSQALALKSSSTATSDSCNGKSACVFRNVAVKPDAQIQVVELGESRGVADGAFTVSADGSCRKDDGDLVCDNALVTQAFRIWVVPEPTAQAIGAAGLEDAVAEGLPGDDTQPDNGK